MAKEFTEQLVKDIVTGLLSGDAKTIRYLTNTYFTDDIKFYHPLFVVEGKEAFYSTYRGFYGWVRSKPIFREYLAAPGKAMCWVNQHGAPRFIPFNTTVIPSLAFLYYRTCPDGLLRIYEQHDHISVYTVPWSIGWPAIGFNNYLVRPFNALALKLSSKLWDFMAEAQESLLGPETEEKAFTNLKKGVPPPGAGLQEQRRAVVWERKIEGM